LIRILILSIFIASTSFAKGVNSDASLATRLSTLIRASLTEKIADVEIRLPSLTRLMSAPPMSHFSEIKNVRLVIDKTNGIAQFEVLGSTPEGKELIENIQTPYEAWKKVPVAVRRVYPNTKLKAEDFKIQSINVATGAAREYRGVMMPEDTALNQYQSKQSILEGQYVITSAVEKTPDIRKGDTVRLELTSGDLTLTTQAVTQEAASVGSQVRVITNKTKRELMGLVMPDHSVEVNL
jgi:flagella basal body P-ring formation protein FlgA